MALLVMVSVPALLMPAPSASPPAPPVPTARLPPAPVKKPLVMVRPFKFTVPAVMESTRLVLLPLRVTSGVLLLSRSPLMVRFLVMLNCPLVRVIVMAALNVMVSPAVAAVMVLRSVPAPESALLVTVKVARLWS